MNCIFYKYHSPSNQLMKLHFYYKVLLEIKINYDIYLLMFAPAWRILENKKLLAFAHNMCKD